MDLSGSERNGSSHEEDMDLFDIEESSPSNAKDINSSGPEASGSSLPGDPDSSEAEDSSAIPPASSVIRFSGPARRQNWSLPDSIIFYMAKNPSTPKLYQKLIRTCKYFFLINPIIICSDLRFKYDDKDEFGVVENNDEDLSAHEDGLEDNDSWQIKQNLIIRNVLYGKVKKDIDLKNYSAKIWIFDPRTYMYTSFIVNGDGSNKNLVSSIIPKIYRCDAAHLRLVNQDISYHEYLFLVSTVSRIELEKVTVKYDDGNVVPVEKLVECGTKATWFNVDFPDISASKTVQNLLTIPHFLKLTDFTLRGIPDAFDIDTLFVYLKQQKRTSFTLDFSDTISAAYKKRLEKIVDEIIEAGGRGGYKSPIIVFPGLDQEKQDKNYMLYLGFQLGNS